MPPAPIRSARRNRFITTSPTIPSSGSAWRAWLLRTAIFLHPRAAESGLRPRFHTLWAKGEVRPPPSGGPVGNAPRRAIFGFPRRGRRTRTGRTRALTALRRRRPRPAAIPGAAPGGPGDRRTDHHPAGRRHPRMPERPQGAWVRELPARPGRDRERDGAALEGLLQPPLRAQRLGPRLRGRAFV